MLLWIVPAWAQQTGAIRGMVYDADFDVPLAAAQVEIIETGQKTLTTDQGNYFIQDVPEGTYTVVFSKDGYARQVVADVVVMAGGRPTDRNASLGGDFTEMEEFVVQDIQIGGPTEAGLIELRIESPSLMDSIGAELMSQAGVSDVADALKLVAGASVADGRFAVVRGLPDRFVNTQINGVRLPTADLDKRAVELDLFPTSIVESIQVSKTFTPDQQGDASGGAVNILLKGIPDEPFIFKVSAGTSYNTNRPDDGEFPTYRGGGVDFLGFDDGRREIQNEWHQPGYGDGMYRGAVGVSRGEVPADYKWSVDLGGRHEFEGLTIGGFGTFFYDRGYSYVDDGVQDTYTFQPGLATLGIPGIDDPIDTAMPKLSGIDVQHGSLFDIEKGTEEVQWGALGTFGLEIADHSLSFVFMHTRTTTDTAILAEDTRSNTGAFPLKAFFVADPPLPYLRNETLQYTERTFQTVQVRGDHTLPTPEVGLESLFMILPPKLDWTLSTNKATFDEPDKRLFASAFTINEPAIDWRGVKPSEQIGFGNHQRIFKTIVESTDQLSFDATIPFRQWTDTEGYLKVGLFADRLNRGYTQESYTNSADPALVFSGGFDDFFSAVFPFEVHKVNPTDADLDYTGEQKINAVYWMLDLPLTPWFRLIGGVRREATDLSTQIDPDLDTPEFGRPLVVSTDGGGNFTLVDLRTQRAVTGDPTLGNTSIRQTDILPAIAFLFEPFEGLSLRGSYTETLARQTFKELTPVAQQEFLGADTFIGNPDLEIAQVKNYDLRVDYRPYRGGLVSVSWFRKDIKDTIENIVIVDDFTATYPVNFPEGQLEGWEVEVRQDLGQFVDWLTGVSVGGNLTLIDSQVQLPSWRTAQLAVGGFGLTSRDMIHAPDYLYNVFFTYDLERTGTQFSVFYSEQGERLLTGPGISGTGIAAALTPSTYEMPRGQLNLTVSQKLLDDHVSLKFSAKNLTNSKFETVYRSPFVGEDVTKTSYTKGIDLSFSVSATFEF